MRSRSKYSSFFSLPPQPSSTGNTPDDGKEPPKVFGPRDPPPMPRPQQRMDGTPISLRDPVEPIPEGEPEPQKGLAEKENGDVYLLPSEPQKRFGQEKVPILEEIL